MSDVGTTGGVLVNRPGRAGAAGVREPAGEGVPLDWETLAIELARLAAALGVEPSRIDDLLQDVHVAMLEKAPRDCPAEELRRWIFRVTINRCHLEHRSKSRWTKTLRRLADWVPRKRYADDAATIVGREEERALVRAALERMDPLVRTVLVMRYFAGLDSKEIGLVLQIPDSTVRSHLRTGRRRLARELERMGYEPD